MLKCETCGCPYVTNVPDGDIHFEEPYEIESLRSQLTTLTAENARLQEVLGRILAAHEMSEVDWDAMREAKAALANAPEKC